MTENKVHTFIFISLCFFDSYNCLIKYYRLVNCLYICIIQKIKILITYIRVCISVHIFIEINSKMNVIYLIVLRNKFEILIEEIKISVYAYSVI